MTTDYSNKNLQGTSFKEQCLADVNFANSDLRGADFSDADLTNANFTNVKTGITPIHQLWIFLAATVVSLLSGYISMLGGHTIQIMLNAADQKIRYAGIAAIAVIGLFIIFCWWKGVKKAINNLILPAVLLAVLIGAISYFSGFGSGRGMLFIMLAYLLTGLMFLVGTVARAAAGSLSNVLFIVVALSGGMFGKSIGGGIGAVVVALACAQISKRALSGAKGFDGLKKVAAFITSRFGTSFRYSRLNQADFSGAVLHNADFTKARLTQVRWDGVKKRNCLMNTSIED